MMPRRRQSGFTLIEVLVALLVLSIGMLGVAAMQLKSLQGAHAAYQRSIATLAAQDAQERLWAQMALDGGGCPDWSDARQIGKADDEEESDAWVAAWSGYLPGFAAASSVSPETSTLASNPDCEFTITISWDETRFSGEGDNPEFTYHVRLPQ